MGVALKQGFKCAQGNKTSLHKRKPEEFGLEWRGSLWLPGGWEEGDLHGVGGVKEAETLMDGRAKVPSLKHEGLGSDLESPMALNLKI